MYLQELPSENYLKTIFGGNRKTLNSEKVSDFGYVKKFYSPPTPGFCYRAHFFRVTENVSLCSTSPNRY